MKNYKFYPAITALFSACLILSNILDTKICRVFFLDLPGGTLLFPVVYVFGDILTEVYGYAHSRRVIWIGFAVLLLTAGSLYAVQVLPPAPFWPHQAAFDSIFGNMPRIVAASFAAYFCGEFMNSYVLAKLKVRSGGKRMALRFVASTILGQFVDTFVFIIVAFAGTMPLSGLVSTGASGWAVKVVWEIAVLPLTLRLVRALKRLEDEDYFDRNTDFNPFRI